MKKLFVTMFFTAIMAVAFSQQVTPHTIDTANVLGDFDTTDEMAATYSGSHDWAASGTLNNLYVTWDATNLYIGIDGFVSTNEGNIIQAWLDVDYGTGVVTGVTDTSALTDEDGDIDQACSYTGTAGSALTFGASFGADYVCATKDMEAADATNWEQKAGIRSFGGITGGATDNFAWYQEGVVTTDTGNGTVCMSIPWTTITIPDGSSSEKLAVVVLIQNWPGEFRAPDSLPQNVNTSSIDRVWTIAVDATGDGPDSGVDVKTAGTTDVEEWMMF